MEKFLSAANDDELAEVSAKIEMILINVWACRWKLEQFPSIIIVDCNSKTLHEISKCYNKIKISGGITRENNRINYVKKLKLH
jgi:hypothetical protein